MSYHDQTLHGKTIQRPVFALCALLKKKGNVGIYTSFDGEKKVFILRDIKKNHLYVTFFIVPFLNIMTECNGTQLQSISKIFFLY